jgi:CubicO group peptidase (beta-lactamase class C family)
LSSAGLLLTLALAGAALWALPRFWRVIAIGSAYKAKVLASLVFGTGRAIDPRRAPEVSSDSYRVMRLLSARVDRDNQSITVSFLGLRPRTSVYDTGLGATLIHGDVRPPQRSPGESRPIDDAVWPVRASGPAMSACLDRAFSEPDRSRLRRTRAVVVLQDGAIVGERYADSFSETTRFSGWSMTKSVLSALIGVLVGEGRLVLKSRELLPEWRPPDPRAAITLEDLLRMRSGLRFSEVYEDLSSDVIEMLFNRADAAAYAASRPLEAPPGTTWSYSSGSTNILSRIARTIVGEDRYVDWPRRVLFDPIGMSSAIMERDGSGTFVGSSFMLATARDWARFGQLYLQDGVWKGTRVLPEGWVRFSTTPTPQAPDGMYGAHWWLKLKPEIGGGTTAAARIPSDVYFAVGHEGQTLTIIPSRKLVAVRLGTSIYIDAWNQAAFVEDLLNAI